MLKEFVFNLYQIGFSVGDQPRKVNHLNVGPSKFHGCVAGGSADQETFYISIGTVNHEPVSLVHRPPELLGLKRGDKLFHARVYFDQVHCLTR